ncbi:Ig-like domain repeat protein [Granulicella mallensis]|uniref:Peptidase S53 propeptide n=1 Tax=Granulicella mallensis (strain ATCC BAA-1857 / DSM 23137 / MP5ACTX8) TaxID=682795 RepID=G8NS41_GRAMM|nr:Ig-like domain repeat protein [Granulicella mallensis]AEU36249.1 Peptidase S53 propeptide [Granulicella mallensis MP5ACTX8]
MRLLPAFWHRFFALFLLGYAATLGLAQTPVQTSVATPLITQAIDESQLVPLKGSLHPLAKPAADQGAASDSLQLGRTILVLKGSEATQASLKKLVDDQQNPKSPSYHKWLTPEQFGKQFGAAPQDIQKVTQWLESYGFSVEAPMPGRNLIMFSGTHAQLKAAFHTEIHSYKVNGQLYWANASDPQIPAALAPVVSGFSSLNNFPRHPMHSQSQLIKRDKSGWKPAVTTRQVHPEFTTTSQGQNLTALGPYDLATIYNVLPLWNAGIDGTNQTIAIVSESDINPADVDYFRTTFGLPPKKLNLIYYGPNPGLLGGGVESEADLDVEWAGAVARNATIDLVVAANTAMSGGIDGAAAYIINNNLASILNVSYGACELDLGTSGNQYYSLIWEQAAAQGITVLAAAGDSGSSVCDDGEEYAVKGLSVSGIASTPYNVAVGGTDFPASFNNPSQYWNSTNAPNTLQSAKSYIPESPWNNSCASPEVLAALQANGGTDATSEAVCNDVNEFDSFLDTIGGSGGASNCTIVGTSTTAPCSGGYPKPAWQSGVMGIPGDGVRDLPDVSLMAGNGLWGSLYVYCQSDATSTGTCDVNNELEGAGGTSFASPIFAGMLALVQQKTASQQGNVNYVLYKLASTQYANSGNAAACSSSTAATGNACLFYDITTGSNAVPCLKGSPDCTPAVATDNIGILPGYNAGAGYDLATGLGSVNAANLVNGWSSAATTFLPTSVAVTSSSPTTVPYGTAINLDITVTPVAPATGTPGGDVGVTTNSTVLNSNSVAEATLASGKATIPATQLPVGTYQLFTNYAGDATFAPSQSNGLPVTITQATASGASVTDSETKIETGQYVTFTLSLPAVSGGVSPTGTATFTNATTGAVLGSRILTPGASTTMPSATAYVTASSSQLQSGVNSITVSYSGDSNYAASNVSAPAVTLAAPFTATINPATLTLAPNATGSVAVTVTPKGAATLNPISLSFSCPATLPAGLACTFSTPVAANGGSVTSTLTLQAATPLIVKSSPVAAMATHSSQWLGAGTIVSLSGLLILLLPRRRRFNLTVLMIAALLSLSLTSGCSGNNGSNSGSSTPALIATSTAVSLSSTTPAFNSPLSLTAKVTPGSGTGTPTGGITFSSGGTSLGTASLASGSATLSTSSLPIGVQSVTAAYGGDATYAASTSSVGSVDVTFTNTITVAVADSVGDTSSAQVAVTIQ